MINNCSRWLIPLWHVLNDKPLMICNQSPDITSRNSTSLVFMLRWVVTVLWRSFSAIKSLPYLTTMSWTNLLTSVRGTEGINDQMNEIENEPAATESVGKLMIEENNFKDRLQLPWTKTIVASKTCVFCCFLVSLFVFFVFAFVFSV